MVLVVAKRCQQFSVYAAEHGVRKGRSFDDVVEIQAWVDALRGLPLWQLRYGRVLRVEVYARDNRRGESVGGWHPEHNAGKLELLRVHWNEREVLHELAHVLAHVRLGRKAAHGPHFARTYLELVYLVMGPGAYAELRDAFTRDGIEHDVEEDERLGAPRPMPAASERS